MLFVAAAVSMLLKEFGDMAIIFIVIAINTAAGVIQEGKALRAMEALKRLSAPTADVIRDGSVKTVPASCLTEGDIVILEAGRIVPADLRLVKTAGLRADESSTDRRIHDSSKGSGLYGFKAAFCRRLQEYGIYVN